MLIFDKMIRLQRMSEKGQTVLHSAPLPPNLGGSEISKSPNLGDLGGECRVLDTSQTSSQSLAAIALYSLALVVLISIH
jgi:hypothetical protein